MARPLRGKTAPRLWPKPLRPLTNATTNGYRVIAFAALLGVRLLPWQRWLLVHAMELLPDGSYRFQTVVVLVARQNGKTTLLKVLALWAMLHDPDCQMVFGTSTNLEYAREAFYGTVELAEARDETVTGASQAPRRAPRGVGPLDTPLAIDLPDDERPAGPGDAGPLEDQVADLIPFPLHRLAAGYAAERKAWIKNKKLGALDTSLNLWNHARYKVGVAGRKGGRSLSVDLGIADELREHKTWAAWSALSGTQGARPNPQLWAITNAGDEESVVLNFLRDQGESFIDHGTGDPTLGLFEWSAAKGAAVDDRQAWAQANPSLGPRSEGYLISEGFLEAKSQLPPEVFRPEHLCQTVANVNPAVDTIAWGQIGDDQATFDAPELRRRVRAFIEVSEDLNHVTLLAAADLADGRIQVEPVMVWNSTNAVMADLKVWLKKAKPRELGWFSTGPTASLNADLEKLRTVRRRPLTATAIPEACQGVAQQIKARRIVHTADPMLTAQVEGATKTPAGDGWRFVRVGTAGHCDAVYAMAGAVHLIRHANTGTQTTGRILTATTA